MISGKNYIDLLVQMLAIPSLSRKEDTRAGFLESWFNSSGLKAKRIHNNLILTRAKSLERVQILLNSHIDTVSPGEGIRMMNLSPRIPTIIE